MTKLNTGLSGCKLELINGLLRKHSASTEYNSRLISQAEKQIVFSKRIYKNIETPKVHDMEGFGSTWIMCQDKTLRSSFQLLL